MNVGMGMPNSEDLQYGANRVELHRSQFFYQFFLVMAYLDKHVVHFLFSFDNRCKTCRNITRFPRYNDPLKVYIFFLA